MSESLPMSSGKTGLANRYSMYVVLSKACTNEDFPNESRLSLKSLMMRPV